MLAPLEHGLRARVTRLAPVRVLLCVLHGSEGYNIQAAGETIACVTGRVQRQVGGGQMGQVYMGYVG
jgi:hypothetical protein